MKTEDIVIKIECNNCGRLLLEWVMPPYMNIDPPETIESCTCHIKNKKYKGIDKIFLALYAACDIICKLCKKVNPQHDNSYCTCDDMDDKRKILTARVKKSWDEIVNILED